MQVSWNCHGSIVPIGQAIVIASPQAIASTHSMKTALLRHIFCTLIFAPMIAMHSGAAAH